MTYTPKSKRKKLTETVEPEEHEVKIGDLVMYRPSPHVELWREIISLDPLEVRDTTIGTHYFIDAEEILDIRKLENRSLESLLDQQFIRALIDYCSAAPLWIKEKLEQIHRLRR